MHGAPHHAPEQQLQPERHTPDVSEAEAADLAAVWMRCEHERLVTTTRRACTSIGSLRSSGACLSRQHCVMLPGLCATNACIGHGASE